MRITCLLSSLWLSGGLRDIVEYVSRLAARGHKLTLITPRGTVDPDIYPELHPQIQVIEAPVMRPRQPKGANPLRLLALTAALARAVPPSDIILSTHTPTTAAGWLASRVLGRGTPVWFYQDYLEMFEGRPVEVWLAKHALGWQAGALTLSHHSRQELLSFSPHFPEERVVVAGVGLSHAEFFHPLPETGLPHAGPRRILFLGDMRPRKGLGDFLAAAEIVHAQQPIQCWIVSKDDCQISSRVPYEYIYRPSRPELARLYATCDLFVLASWWESFGIPPLEAMACSAPVVMTDTRGGRDYARPGENCLMVPPRDPDRLAEAMLQVLKDPALAQRLRHNGPPTAARFTWEAAVDRFEAALMAMASQPGKPGSQPAADSHR